MQELDIHVQRGKWVMLNIPLKGSTRYWNEYNDLKLGKPSLQRMFTNRQFAVPRNLIK